MPNKDEAARRLAQIHCEYEPGISQVFRITAAEEHESRASEPIKLLEVNRDTVPSGIVPLQFDPHPASGNFPSVVVEVTPEEFQQIELGSLRLPEGWVLGELLRCS
jgi:hypothetical protein